MLHTLGGLHLEGAARQQAGPLVLLTYLALEGPQERRGVQELFFPGHADPAGRLRMMLHRLKTAAPSALETRGTRLQTLLSSDAAELFRAAERGEAAQVLSLYQGRFLDGVRLPGEQDLEEWVFATRERLCARVRTCHLGLGRASALWGDTGLTLTHAERAYLLPGAPEPGRDEARLLALLLTAAGSAFAADARTEAREAGPLPDQAADALALLGEPGLDLRATRRPVEGAAPNRRRTDAGNDSGKLNGGEPDSDGADNGGADHGRVDREAADVKRTESGDAALPALLGREDALAQIAACFAGGARLVTLLGQGGMGKTLLARHALQRAVQQVGQGRRDHTGLLPGIMVDLSAVHDEAGVLPAIASAVGARTAQLPDVAQSVRGYELLLLDNFEQVLIFAPRIAELLELAPSLRLLITSRERLHLSQEHVLPLEGLAVHSSDVPSTQPAWSDAARLFVRRATRAHLGFVPGDHRADIEQVCTLLRGVPLLIELASAWVRTLSPLDIAAQLGGGRLQGADLSSPDLDLLETQDRDVPARHASARAVLEASWRRLNAQEQARLSRLAVFLSDFTPRAARQVCGATLSGLADLTDKSWLGAGAGGGSGRLSWHPLARAFVREASGDQSSSARPSSARPAGGWKETLPDHAHYFAQGLNASRFQAETLAELLGEWPDIGQAARTLAGLPEDWPTLTRLAREVPVWTEQVGNYASVAGLIGRVLGDLPVGASPRAQLLRARAFMYVRMHRLQDATEDYRKAADLLIQSGDEREVLAGLDALAVVHHQAGEYAQAEAIWLDILKRVEPLGLLQKQSYTLQYLALNALNAGRPFEAETWIRAALETERRLPPRTNLVDIHAALGMTLTRMERRAEAHLVLTEGIRLAHQIRAVHQIPDLMNFLALNLLELGRPQEAVRLCLEALASDQIDRPALRAELFDTLALCYGEAEERVLARQALAQSTKLTVQLEIVPDLLHRLYTFTLIEKTVFASEDHAAVLHWLLGHQEATAPLKTLVLREIVPEIQPARTLPPIDVEVISSEAQRRCGYVAGEPSIMASRSF